MPTCEDPIAILANATKSGWRTSEFWLSVAGVAVSLVLPHVDPAVDRITGTIAQHGTVGVVAAGAIAGAYAVGRSIVKAATAKALLAPVPPPVTITSEADRSRDLPSRR